MSKINEDGGYDHFHPHGRKPPSHTTDKSDNGGLGYTRAPNSGKHNLGNPTGMPPEGMPEMPNATPVGS